MFGGKAGNAIDCCVSASLLLAHSLVDSLLLCVSRPPVNGTEKEQKNGGKNEKSRAKNEC